MAARFVRSQGRPGSLSRVAIGLGANPFEAARRVTATVPEELADLFDPALLAALPVGGSVEQVLEASGQVILIERKA
jgi:hypothetical protein